jgi:transcriptional regulator with XRE-family HTH domain
MTISTEDQVMKKAKKERLTRAGWKVGSTQEFLGLNDEETQFIEMKLALARSLKERRLIKRWTQDDLARELGSSQSRVAKMEAADASVSIDLLVRSLLALGATRQDVSRIIGAKSATPAPNDHSGSAKRAKTDTAMKTKTMSTAVVCVLICTTSVAESWPTLDEYVKRCDLIVLCETEIVDEQPIFKVTEEWKGKYKTTDFNEHLQARVPNPGYLPAGLGLHSGGKSYARQKVVFFFTHAKEKYNGSSTSFDVRGGKLIYAETGWPGMRKEYTLNEFKKAILATVKSEKERESRTGD